MFHVHNNRVLKEYISVGLRRHYQVVSKRIFQKDLVWTTSPRDPSGQQDNSTVWMGRSSATGVPLVRSSRDSGHLDSNLYTGNIFANWSSGGAPHNINNMILNFLTFKVCPSLLNKARTTDSCVLRILILILKMIHLLHFFNVSNKCNCKCSRLCSDTSHISNFWAHLCLKSGADLTQVSDVPLRVQCCVFVMKDYKHGWSRHTSCHGTAVYVLPVKRGKDFW